MSRFIHLHTHSHYSLLNALPKIPDLVAAAKADGMDSLALTDAGNLYGAIEFYKECKQEGIHPIIGIDAYVAARMRTDKEPGVDNRRARLIVLAKNLEGYRNLLKLITDSGLEGFYYKPRVDREILAKYHEGLIAIPTSFSGEIANALRMNDQTKAKEIFDWYTNTFGKENVFLEITHHPEIDGHESLQERIITFAREHSAALVAAHDVYYLKPEDRRARETMVKIQSGGTLAEEGQSGFDDAQEDFSFISQDQAEKLFKATPDALLNTLKIASMCALELPLGHWSFPIPQIDSGRTPDDELRFLALEGIKTRGLVETPELMNRLEHELGIITQKGYASYFIVVADLLRFAREHDIYTNIRGSVAGSLVTYVTGVTKVNPLEYKIPFERFLNPERPSAPDIDMDFADNRRDEVIEYAKQKYGVDKVSQIGTFGTMMARAAVRDVARALGHPYAVGDRIAKLIPIGSQGFPMTLAHAMEIEPELLKLYKGDKDAKEVIDLSKKIEGCARHISVHAAGVVISPTPLTDYTPLQLDPKGGKIITQYDMYSIDENNAGLLKFDFLGIKNLSILADSVKRVQKIRNIDIDIEKIPLDDPKTFAILSQGETMGLFQLNGSGMTRFLKELKPTTIHDINAMVALYRPGPLESIPQYIERKHAPSLISYLDPRLKNILDQSYGVITYQDDVLMIAVEIGGYSWLEVDKLRKAMGKKIPAEMEAQKEKLIEGFISHGKLTKEKAERLWKLIEPFAAYGFNKAHAASYGRVAYQTAYMKANFPVEYMACVLTADSGDVEKVSEIITEVKRMNIQVLPPDVNESFGVFSVVPDEPKIRFGLYSIKNFGTGIGDVIIEERKKNGPYESLADFLKRIQDKNLNKKSLEALIMSGALDAFGERGQMMANVENMQLFNKEASSNGHQDSLFGGMTEGGVVELQLAPAEPASKTQKLQWEKELLGLYISGHPLDSHAEKLKNRGQTITQIKTSTYEGVTTVVGGIIEDLRIVLTKKGDKMAFAKVADMSGSIEIVFFPKLYAEKIAMIVPEACIAVKGKFSMRNGEASIVADAVKEL